MATGLNHDTELPNFRNSWKKDLGAGFLVFLIALPLCLGISLASGYPPMAGIFTAVVGGIVTALLSGAQLTIKGPAAGLIVVALGCVTDFGFTAGQNAAADAGAYRKALAVGVAAGVIQIAFGFFKIGILGDFFPLSAVHGMLAAIGFIIILKQLPILLGLSMKGAPLENLVNLPGQLGNVNPEIAILGVLSLVILFSLPQVKNRWLKKIPGPMLVLLVTVPLGLYFDLETSHTYTWHNHIYQLGSNFLVNLPMNVLQSVAFPDFSALKEAVAWKWVAMFSLVGSLESLLSAKAVDLLDPWQRKTNMDRDLLAIGVANTAVSLIGGLPMISEIVRSRANIDNGARTKWANAFHGLFIILFVSFFPQLIHQIPLAALAAMLVFTGYRLASPKEFVKVAQVGREQLVIYVATIVGVLATDLLIGIGIGILVDVGIHLMHGVPLRSLFRQRVHEEDMGNETLRVIPTKAAVFTSWIGLQRRLYDIALVQKKSIVLDLSRTELIDHTVMEKLHQLERELKAHPVDFEVVGLERHFSFSQHPLSTRLRTEAYVPN